MRNLKIVTVGGSGVGKSVYLAALHDRLCVRRVQPDRAGLHGEVARLEGHRLQQLHLRIGDTGQPLDWGDPNDITQSWSLRLTLYADSLRNSYPMLAVDYVDYAGELATGTAHGAADLAAPARWLDARLAAADVLLGFLDGRRLLRLMTDAGNTGRDYLREEVYPVAWTLGANRSASIVHLAVTKWDLLQDRGITLAAVKERLTADREFAAAMRYVMVGSQARSRGVVRLIPVSAVGPGFAQLDGAGRMVKNPGAQMRPTNITAPLYLAIQDVVTQSLARRQGNRLTALRHRFGPHQADIQSLADGVVKDQLPGQDAGSRAERALAGTVLRGLLDWMLKPAEQHLDPVTGPRPRRTLRRDRKDAYQHAVNEIVDDLHSYSSGLDRANGDALVVPDHDYRAILR